jgi:hypothetical protein
MRMAESRFDFPGGTLLNEDPEYQEEHVLSCLLGLEGPSKLLGSRYKAVRRPRQPQTERRPGSPPSQVVGTHEARRRWDERATCTARSTANRPKRSEIYPGSSLTAEEPRVGGERNTQLKGDRDAAA